MPASSKALSTAFALVASLTVSLASTDASAAKKKVEAPPPAPVGPPPSMQLEVVPIAELHGPWRVRIVNTGSVPVRLVADAHLVSLDIRAPGTAPAVDDEPMPTKRTKRKKAKADPGLVHCRMPADMRPSDDEARSLVVPPNRSYVEAFDIRSVCFGAELDALVAGATVTAHFGWTPPAPAKANAKNRRAPRIEPPFAVSPIESDGAVTASPIPVVSPLKEIDGSPFVLAAATTSSTPPGVGMNPSVSSAAARDSEAPKHGFALSLPRYHDQETRIDIPAPITVTNDDSRTREILFRASRVRYDVVDPAGTRTVCGAPPDEQPLRELFTHLAPGHKESLPMLVSAMCDPDTFARAGVYEITAHIDDRDLSGANLGLSAFDGELTSGIELIRLHRDARPFPRRRPHLE